MNNNIEKLDEKELVNIIENLSCEEMVIWVGAGVDMNQPTCLPNGKDLMEFILGELCGDDVAERLLKKWTKMAKIINKTSVYEFSCVPRLETIVDILKTCEENIILPDGNKLTNLKILETIIETLGKAPINAIHMVLAFYLLNGASIVTTNYNYQIIQACKCIEPNCDFTFYNVDNVTIFENRINCNTGKVYYLHGHISEIENIGTTLSVVKNAVSVYFVRQMNKWLENNKYFLFLGYSGCDVFDINKLFLSYFGKIQNGTGIFLAHSKTNNIDVTEKMKILLIPFCNKYYTAIDVPVFFDRIAPDYIKDYVLKFGQGSQYEWKSEYAMIVDKSNYTDEMKYVVCQYLCGVFGINVDLIYRKKKLSFTKNTTKWMNAYSNYVMARVKNDEKEQNYNRKLLERITNAHNYLEEEEDQSYGKYSEKYVRDNALIVSHQLSELIKQESVIDWSISTPINLMSKTIVRSALRDGIKTCSIQYQKEGNALIQALRTIAKLNYNQVVEIHQIHVAQRQLGMLIYIFEEDFETAVKLLDEALYYYSELSRVDGVIGTLAEKMKLLKLARKKKCISLVKYYKEEVSLAIVVMRIKRCMGNRRKL